MAMTVNYVCKLSSSINNGIERLCIVNNAQDIADAKRRIKRYIAEFGFTVEFKQRVNRSNWKGKIVEIED